jgi:aryl-alcohol dehydrogenase-like predicted oxidoreductase
VAIAAVMQRPWADVVLSGAATVDELRSNLQASSVELSANDVLELAACHEPAATYWAARSRMAWA